MGYRRKSNLAASKGTIVHKALELLARKKLSIQNGYAGFTDEYFGQLKNDDVSPERATLLAYDYYSTLDSHHDWDKSDLKECTKWTNKAITVNDSCFNPLNLNVVDCEKFFDISIQENWAKYSYKIDGKAIEGFLNIRGTLDLIVENSEAIELVDWKTGRKIDWATKSEKDFEKLRKDIQLRLYYWALRQLYPGKTIIISIVYINYGGAVTLFYDDNDYEETIWMFRKYFNRIRNTVKPKLIWPHWWCNKLCQWSQPLAGEDKPFCHKVRDEIVQIGMDKVTNKYCKDKSFMSYEGGGKRLDSGT